MENNKIDIAALQETKLTGKSNIKNTPNYTMVRKDRGTNKGGGIAFLIHEDLNFQLDVTPATLENDPHIESDTITIISKESSLQIRNVYIPPTSSCQQGYSPPIKSLFENLSDTSLILGDVNAHHDLWLSEATSDARGRKIVDTISGLDFGIINDYHPTRAANNSTSSPDISIASSNIIPSTTWKAELKMKSDHLPIIISLSTEIQKV